MLTPYLKALLTARFGVIYDPELERFSLGFYVHPKAVLTSLGLSEQAKAKPWLGRRAGFYDYVQDKVIHPYSFLAFANQCGFLSKLKPVYLLWELQEMYEDMEEYKTKFELVSKHNPFWENKRADYDIKLRTFRYDEVLNTWLNLMQANQLLNLLGRLNSVKTSIRQTRLWEKEEKTLRLPPHYQNLLNSPPGTLTSGGRLKTKKKQNPADNS